MKRVRLDNSRSRTYMFLAVVAHAGNPHLALQHGVFQRPPTVQPRLFPAIRTVQQEQINIPQPTRPHALLDTLPHSLIAPLVLRQLARVVDILPLELRVLFQVCEDGGADFALVVVHLRAVEGAVTGFEGVLHGKAGFAAAGEVDSEVDVGDGEGGGVGEGLAGGEGEGLGGHFGEGSLHVVRDARWVKELRGR